MKRYLAVVAAALVLASCATPAPAPVDQRNSALTSGNVSMNLTVGQTNQAQVLEAFGAPNIVTMDGQRNEVWSYQRHATVTQASAGSNYWTIVLVGGGQYAEGFQQTQRTITLIIKFDANKVVSDFRSRSSDF
jgi:outer membrane protein assembly factor BamE (lipoprotein component of BamABCDE complex)